MRIDRIAELRTCTVLRDFHWPSDLPNFARYNLIYGWNGSGKTTLSRVFRALEDRVSPPPSWQAVLVADGQSMKGEEFAQATTAIRVFNRDFVDESVFPTSGGVVPPILVLGKESVEKQKELDRLKGEREQEEARCATARSATQEAKRNLDHFSIGRAKAIKDALRSSGENPYNNYDKSHFGARAEQLAADAKAAAHRLSDVERDSLLVQLRVTHRPKIQTLSYRFPELGPVRAT
ncbi:MAG: AAA family ATPase, partial [Nitrospirae bacterium]|nr:AAA family ATPase [Nitrospirota bacterium]